MAKTYVADQNVSDNSAIDQEQLPSTSHTQPAACIQSKSNNQLESRSSSAQMDALGTDSDSTSATRRSFAELMPLSKRSCATKKRPRAKPPSYELTSEEHFQFIAAKCSSDKGSNAPKTKKTRQNRKPTKVPLKSKKPVDQVVRCLIVMSRMTNLLENGFSAQNARSGQNIEPCTDVSISAAARRVILTGGGGAPIDFFRRRRRQ